MYYIVRYVGEQRFFIISEADLKEGYIQDEVEGRRYVNRTFAAYPDIWMEAMVGDLELAQYLLKAYRRKFGA